MWSNGAVNGRGALVAIAVAHLLLVVLLVRWLAARRRADRGLASLDALLVHAPVGIAFLDRDLRFVRANGALGRISERDPRDMLGLTLDEAIGRPELTVIARRVLETGVPVFDVDVSGVTTTGRPFHALAGYYPVEGSDGVEGVGVVVRDVTATTAAALQRDELLARVTRLQHITGALARASTTADVAAVVLDDVRSAAEAAAVSLCNVVGDEIEVLASDGYSPEVLATWHRFPLDARMPLAEAVRHRRLVVGANREAIRDTWPELSADMAPDRQAIVALPMVVDGVVRGAIGLSFDHELALRPEDEDFLMAVATQCGSSFRRVRLHESETAALASAEAAAVRLAFLAEASDALASSLDWSTTLHRVAELAVPRLADTAAVFVVDGEEVAALELVDVDPVRGEHLRRTAERWPAHLDHRHGLGAVARTGEPFLYTDIRPEQLRSGARDEHHASALVDAGFTSILAVPMRAGDRVVGLIVLADAAPRELTEDDLRLATELATRAGQAVLNAELFRDRSNIAAILQASLLPPATPSVPGLEVATRFFAVGAGIDVGGDFYDVVRLGTAAAPDDRWAVVIGDVRGKGTEAASISGAARHAIRSAALRERSPAAMLRQLNDLLLVMADADDPEPRFCTVVVAVVEPTDGGARVVLASAGHPAPMILRADGRTEAVDRVGTVLGVLPDAELADTSFELGTADALVLYTDGVTERHAGNRFFDEEALSAVLSRCTGFTASVLAERIETASRAFVEDAPRDDLAIVVVRVPERRVTSTATSTDLPADVTAPTVGRRFVGAALDALGLGAHQEVAALLTSEVVTNAILHGEAPVRISVESRSERVRIVVSDGSTTHPEVLPPSSHRPRGRGMYLVEALATAWGVEVHGSGKSVWFELA